MNEYKEAFSLFDADNSGKIDSKEMGYVLRSLGESPVEAEINDIIRTIDKDGNGQIDFQEFCIFMHNKRASVDPEQEIESLFQLFDKD